MQKVFLFLYLVLQATFCSNAQLGRLNSHRVPIKPRILISTDIGGTDPNDNQSTDRANPELYDGKIQGGLTVKKWRNDVLQDWAKRWAWLKN